MEPPKPKLFGWLTPAAPVPGDVLAPKLKLLLASLLAAPPKTNPLAGFASGEVPDVAAFVPKLKLLPPGAAFPPKLKLLVAPAPGVPKVKVGFEAAAGVLEGPPKLKLLVGFPVPKVKVGFDAAGVVVAALAAAGALAACPNGVGAVLDMGG